MLIADHLSLNINSSMGRRLERMRDLKSAAPSVRNWVFVPSRVPVWMIFFISSNSKNRIFESKYVTILISRWSLSMLFSLHLTSLYSLIIWTHPRCSFPLAAAAALSLGIGAVLGVGSPQVPTRYHSWARLYRWVTGCPKPCPGDPMGSFPLSLRHFSGQQLPVPSPPL